MGGSAQDAVKPGAEYGPSKDVEVVDSECLVAHAEVGIPALAAVVNLEESAQVGAAVVAREQRRTHGARGALHARGKGPVFMVGLRQVLAQELLGGVGVVVAVE